MGVVKHDFLAILLLHADMMIASNAYFIGIQHLTIVITIIQIIIL